MSRYIDADKLRKDEIARCHCVPLVGSGDNNYKNLDEVLNDAPTADVVEARHGEWKKTITGIICSVCDTHEARVTSYCPNCGAKMDGERKRNEEDNRGSTDYM